MRFPLAVFLLFMSASFGFAENLNVDGVGFAYRVPKMHDSNSRIMVLFGGRNWRGEDTIKAFGFASLADRHSLFILSPTFNGNEYWEPHRWSGKVLLSAIEAIEKEYGLKRQKLLFYGYSAGGQCASLFYDFMSSQVEAWGAHACGVYPAIPRPQGASAIITCGTEDLERLQISKAFIYKYRENGGRAVWKQYSGGHELHKEALVLAGRFFDDILTGKLPYVVGEDDSMRSLPVADSDEIDIEFRNYLTSPELKTLWEGE